MTPVKGTVWRHAVRKDWNGEPLELTVTSVTPSKIYSRVGEYSQERIKTPVEAWDKMCAEIVSVPDPAAKKVAPTFTEAEVSELLARAHAAGMAAGEAAMPTPMYVVEREHPFDDQSRIVKRYPPVMDGVCGFAWITVYGGNTSFGRHLRKRGYRAGYPSGIQIWVGEFNQSLTRKEAFAHAYAEVLREAGVTAYAGSRMD